MTQIEEYQQLINMFSDLDNGLTIKRIGDYHDMIADFTQLEKYLIKNASSSALQFNPLQLLKIGFDENTHSDILAWALDPYATHNQGDLFFRAFIEWFNFKVIYDEINYKVIREFAGHESIIDILIYGESFIFYIENKTLSSEGYKQTEREYRDLRRLAKTLGIKDNIYAIFLTPYGSQAQNKHFTAISYSQLIDALESKMGEIKSKYVQYFINSWINTIKEEIGR